MLTASQHYSAFRPHLILAWPFGNASWSMLLEVSFAAPWMQVVEVNIDASDVPSEYALTILSECAAFPRRLVFFLKGTLSVRALLRTCSVNTCAATNSSRVPIWRRSCFGAGYLPVHELLEFQLLLSSGSLSIQVLCM